MVADHGGDQREERGGEGRPVLEGRPDHQPPHRADGDDADEGASQHVSDRALDVIPLARERWLPADVAGRVRLRRRETSLVCIIVIVRPYQCGHDSSSLLDSGP